MNKYRICISSPPDPNKLVAEIFFEDIQWVEINQEKGLLEIEFYARPDGQSWKICYWEKIFQSLLPSSPPPNPSIAARLVSLRTPIHQAPL